MTAGRPLALLLLGLVVLGCAPSRERGAFDFERMRRQTRRDTWDSTARFADGMVMRTPPPHTVRHGEFPIDPARVEAWTRDSSHLAAGRRHFAVSCAPCHGATGLGGGTVAINLVPTPPPPLRTAAVRALSDSALLSIVTDGIGRMPPPGWQLSPVARVEVVAWLRHLQTAPPTGAATTADSARAARIARAVAAWQARDAARRRAPPEGSGQAGGS